MTLFITFFSVDGQHIRLDFSGFMPTLKFDTSVSTWKSKCLQIYIKIRVSVVLYAVGLLVKPWLCVVLLLGDLRISGHYI